MANSYKGHADIWRLKTLKDICGLLVTHDLNYPERRKLVFKAMYYAESLGFDVGFEYDPVKFPDFPFIIYIQLPEFGQVSWHTGPSMTVWDGHTPKEKLDRLWRFSKMGSFRK